MPSSVANPRGAVGVVAALAILSLTGGCVGTELPPSSWPPADFVVELEEVRFAGESVDVLRRFRVDASGIALYGESRQPLMLPESNVSLPRFDVLSVYQLPPPCVRALSRRISRVAAADVSADSAQRGTSDTGLVVRWQAAQVQREFTGMGRVHGALAELVALIAAHLPPGANLQTQLGRPVVRVLRGVLEPVDSVAGALQAYRELRERGESGANFLLEGFALACASGERDDADRWLAAWASATAQERAARPAFSDKVAPLQPAQLRQLLPQQ